MQRHQQNNTRTHTHTLVSSHLTNYSHDQDLDSDSQLIIC